MTRLAAATVFGLLVAVGCGDGSAAEPARSGHHGDSAPAPPAGSWSPPAVTSLSLLAQLDRALAVRADTPGGEAIVATARMQPWCEDERLWYSPPVGAGAVTLPEVELREGAELVVGLGLAPGSAPPPEASGAVARLLVRFERGDARETVVDLDVALDDLAPGEAITARAPVSLPPGPATLVFRLDASALPEGVVPALRDLRLVQPGGGGSPTVRSVVERVSLLGLHGGDGLPRAANTDAFRARPEPEARGLVPDDAGPLLAVPVPGETTFDVPRDADARLVFRVTEDVPPDRQGAVRFAVTVDGRETWSRVLNGYRRWTSPRIVVPLGAGDASTTRVTLGARWVHPDRAPEEPAHAIWIRPVVERLADRPRQSRDDGPSVLLVVVDAARADHFSHHGYERGTTPELAALAAEAVVFERALAPSSWTVPSMASLFTGQHAYTHGLYDESHWLLDPDVPTLAETFREAGLSTVCVMSNPLLDRTNGALRGYEHVDSVPLAHAAQVNRLFLDWLDAHVDERFFATLHHFDPHDPYAAPGDDLARYLPPSVRGRATPELFKTFERPVRKALRALPEGAGRDRLDERNRTQLARLIDLYDAELASWDARFGELLEALAERGALRDTVVLVTSDHGEAFADHGMLGHGRTLHDELLHVPLVLWHPDLEAERRGELVSLLDVAPTLLRLTGVDRSALGGPPLVGTDLLERGARREFLFAQTSHGERTMDGEVLEMRAVITPEGKAIQVAGVDGLRLYDTADDPAEARPLEPDPDLEARLLDVLAEWDALSRNLAGWSAAPGALDPDVEATMRALGYLK